MSMPWPFLSMEMVSTQTRWPRPVGSMAVTVAVESSMVPCESLSSATMRFRSAAPSGRTTMVSQPRSRMPAASRARSRDSAFQGQGIHLGQDVFHRDDLPPLLENHVLACPGSLDGHVLVGLLGQLDRGHVLGGDHRDAAEGLNVLDLVLLDHHGVHPGFERQSDQGLVEGNGFEDDFFHGGSVMR